MRHQLPDFNVFTKYLIFYIDKLSFLVYIITKENVY